MIVPVIGLAIVSLIAVVSWLLVKLDVRSISHRLEDIRQSRSNAKITTQTFDPDITALANQINALLEEQKQAAIRNEQASRELRQSITNISHDLKTPLTSAMGYLQMIKSGRTPPEKKAEYIDIIARRLAALSDLLEELFEFSRLYEGKIEPVCEGVNVCNLLGDVLSLYYEDLTRKDITPAIQFPREPVYVLADASMLKRVFQNLIQNALIHGTTFFSVAVDPGARITFRNALEDMESIDPSRLFDRFYTADVSRDGRTTGLGLAICKELVARQGGTIGARIEEGNLVISIEMGMQVT